MTCKPKRRKVRFSCAIAVVVVLLAPSIYSRLMWLVRSTSIHEMEFTSTPSVSTTPLTLRIATYNIAHGRGLAVSNWDGGDRDTRTTRLDDIADLLTQINADIVVLNEIDFKASWSNGINQTEYLAKRAGYQYRAEQRNVDVRVLTWSWTFGNAILSRHPITNTEIVDLPGYSWLETLLAGKKRGLACDIFIHGTSIRVIGAHLSHRSESLRTESAQFLMAITDGSLLPVIIAGDFNSTPSDYPGTVSTLNGGNAIDMLDASGLFRRWAKDSEVAQHMMTFHSTQPTSVIDWIFIPKTWRFTRYDVEHATLSDHRLVYADVELK